MLVAPRLDELVGSSGTRIPDVVPQDSPRHIYSETYNDLIPLLPRSCNRLREYLLQFTSKEFDVPVVGRDSSVGIATRYGVDGPGIESRRGRDFPHPSRPTLGLNQLAILWVSGHSWG